ncbi:hypothetical protein, partial [Pseudonocardia lacus]|uniref:hypothetical protein n=1 Tax=Pseudonocardia lacus TaxID=2835865 RepID=UPI001BDCD371
ATRVRPLATALARLDPAQREHHRLAALTGDAPLPRGLRALVRRPEIAPAHAMDAVGRAVRRAMGELHATGAPALTVVRDPPRELLCALVIAATCAGPADGTVRLTAPGASAVPRLPALRRPRRARPLAARPPRRGRARRAGRGVRAAPRRARAPRPRRAARAGRLVRGLGPRAPLTPAGLTGRLGR